MAEKKREPKKPDRSGTDGASKGAAPKDTSKGAKPRSSSKRTPADPTARASKAGAPAERTPRSSRSSPEGRTPRTPPTPARDIPDSAPEPSPAPTVVETVEPVRTGKTSPSVSGWRQRLYRIPLLGAIAYVIWPPKTTPSIMRRGVSSTLAIVALLGIGMAAYPWAGDKYPFFYKIPVEKLIEWSNFLSDLQTNKLQGKLAKEFEGLDKLSLKEGGPLTRFEIPKFGVDTIVVQGTSVSALRAGAGHYPTTVLPGQKGNMGIAGHRTTYGRPFNRIDDLVIGDKIILTTPVARYTYEVSKPPWITTPYDWTIVGKTKEAVLTLTTCHPIGSARERLVVRAKLVKTEGLRSA